MFSLAKESNIKLITKEQFDKGRTPRFGRTNPEKMDIAYWRLATGYYIDPWWSRKYFLNGEDHDSPNPEDNDNDASSKDELETLDEEVEKAMPEPCIGDSIEADELGKPGDTSTNEARPVKPVREINIMGGGPIWCTIRFGQTKTKLPDGTTVRIAGEHEDFYDPDFHVYNDVIVYPPGASLAEGHSDFVIYGYPETVFPKTDFHTATYVPQLHSILVLGNMSSDKEDDSLAARGITPVYLLEVGTWKFEKKETRGDGPGIIWRHVAKLVDGALRVAAAGGDIPDYMETKRKAFKDGKSEIVEVQIGTVWELSTEDWTWERKTSEWTTEPEEELLEVNEDVFELWS